MSFGRLSTTALKDKDKVEIKRKEKKNNFNKNISKCYSNENENKTQDGRKETVQILKWKKEESKERP